MTSLYIESQKNPKVQSWSGLKTRKGRVNAGAFLAEGARLAEEALKSDRQLECLLLDVAANDDFESLQELARSRGVVVHELSPQAFAAVSDTVTSQGIIAVVRQTEQKPEYSSQTLIVDGVQDPGNVGTLLRTADAFGIPEVCCSLDAADPLSPKVVRASMGGVFRLSLIRTDVVRHIEAWVKQWPDGQVIITEASGARPCNEIDFTKPSLIVIGSEATGVSAPVRRMASTRVYIPMAQHVESLNAGVAGSIVLYEAYRQRQG